MYNYIISFRIHEDDDASNNYNERYTKLEAYIQDTTKINKYWGCTTSFFIVKSMRSIQNISRELRECLCHPQDRFLIYHIETKEALYKGPHDEFSSLKSFIPTAGPLS